MNPNDLIAQQQAMLNQVMQNQQNWVWGMIAVQISLVLLGACHAKNERRFGRILVWEKKHYRPNPNERV
jgi:hypothetical protein